MTIKKSAPSLRALLARRRRYTTFPLARALQENNACSHQSCYTAVLRNPLRVHAPSTQSIIPEYGGLKALSRSSLQRNGWRESKKKKKGSQRGSKTERQCYAKRAEEGRGGGYVGETRQDAVRGKVWCMARLQEATPMLFLRRLSAAWSCILRLAWKRELKQRFCFFIFSTPHPSSHPVPVICFFFPVC